MNESALVDGVRRQFRLLAGAAKGFAAGDLFERGDGGAVVGVKTMGEAVNALAGRGHMKIGQKRVHRSGNAGTNELATHRHGHHEVFAIRFARRLRVLGEVALDCHGSTLGQIMPEDLRKYCTL